MKGKWIKAWWWSLLINAFVVLSELVIAPAHAGGRWQGVAGYVDGAAHVMQLPGLTVASVGGLRPNHHRTWPAFWVQLAINLPFWWITCAALMRNEKTGTGGLEEDKTAPESVSQSRVSRRDLLLGGGRAFAGVGAATGSYSFFAEPRWFEINHHTVPIRGLPRSLDHLRIVHLTDIHHGAWMSIEWVRQIVDAANSLAPDLVALTGDYTYRGTQYTRPVARELARLRPAIAVLGVLGNHDWWETSDSTRTAFAEAGLPLIDNARRFITPTRRLAADAREGLCIAGVGDLWEDKCLYDAALAGVPGGMPRILLSHHPDVAEEPAFLASGHRVDLMLSGHTHGGQVRLPLLGAPVTNSRYGQKYAMGLMQGPVCPVFISKGLGMTALPVRFNARPEIAVIELHCS